ncbi:MAG: cyclic nucleotide-binding domain-containing protein [Gammaproteobacteria bacterium]|nr:cyclic nucleotide-binding domain-containing protein [Gammaproteobacteria bacterium]
MNMSGEALVQPLKTPDNKPQAKGAVDLSVFEPFNAFTTEMIDTVIKEASVDRLPPGRRIFNQGDIDGKSVFLLSGQIALIADGHPAITIKAGTNEALQAVADNKPREVTALARSSVTLMSVATELLYEMSKTTLIVSAKKSNSAGDSKESRSRSARIERVLNSPLFFRLPSPHVQVLTRRLEEVYVKAGEVVVNEGDDGEYYYVITMGSCMVTRVLKGTDKKSRLAELGIGRGFGEGALIGDMLHSSTVSMLEDGALVRIPKSEFMTLLVTPYIKRVSYEQMLMMQDEGAVLLDVRIHSAFERMSLRGSINLPLATLWKAASILDKSKEYVVCCDIGKRSTIAAFLMAQQGLNARILEGGLQDLHEQQDDGLEVASEEDGEADVESELQRELVKENEPDI